MKLTCDLGGGRVMTTEVDAALAASARGLLDRLAPLAAVLAPSESKLVEIDWAPIRLTDRASEISAAEPDYHGDPDHFVPSLSVSSRIFAVQDELTALFALAASPIAAGHYIEVAAAALTATAIVGWRKYDPASLATGWRIIPADAAADQRSGMYLARELVRLRPAWFGALHLPPDWGFRFVGDKLTNIEGPDLRNYTLFLSPLGPNPRAGESDGQEQPV